LRRSSFPAKARPTEPSDLHQPADAFVVGEPVQVTDVDYEGNPRLGLRATCRRRDERHVVGFADVVFAPGSAGVEPASPPGEGDGDGDHRGLRRKVVDGIAFAITWANARGIPTKRVPP
jgi:hypothetical protein